MQKIWNHLFHKPRIVRRTVMLFISVYLMGAGVAVFDQLGFGVDPCALFNLAFGRLIGMSYGNWLLIFNVILFLMLVFLGELRRIGIGSLANMVLIGYSADFTTWIINSIHPLTGETFLVRLGVFFPMLALFLLASAIYNAVDLGVAPYDAMPYIMSERIKKLRFAHARMAWDLTFLIMGALLGGTVGAVTFGVGFFAGPVFAWITRKIKPFLQ